MLRPVSINSNKMYFTSSKNTETSSESVRKINDDTMTKQDVKNGFLVGTLLGMLMATTGTIAYKNIQIDNVMDRLVEEMDYAKDSDIIITDMTDDGIRDFVLQDKNGEQTVFDVASGKTYLKEDDGLIELY